MARRRRKKCSAESGQKFSHARKESKLQIANNSFILDSSMNQHPTYMMKALIEREQNGLLRKLKNSFPEIDFCSNDYLGFSRLGLLQKKFEDNGSHLTS